VGTTVEGDMVTRRKGYWWGCDLLTAGRSVYRYHATQVMLLESKIEKRGGRCLGKGSWMEKRIDLAAPTATKRLHKHDIASALGNSKKKEGPRVTTLNLKRVRLTGA